MSPPSWSPTSTSGWRRRWPPRGSGSRPTRRRCSTGSTRWRRRTSANRVIVVGDVKHSIGKVQDIDWGIIPWFFGTLLDIFQAVEVVPGNHDGAAGGRSSRPG